MSERTWYVTLKGRRVLNRVSLFIALVVVTLVVADAHAQTCTPPAVCASGADINAAADALCRRARAAELRLTDEVLPDMSAAQTQRDACHGRLAQLTEHPPTPPQPYRPPLWLRLALDVTVGATAAATGACAGVGCPPEVTAGLAVSSVAALVGRVVLEVLR